MRPLPLIFVSFFGLSLLTRSAALPELQDFATYRQGDAVSRLAAARQAVFKSTATAEERSAAEDALLALLKGDATTMAKQYAVRWLGVVGSKKSLPALTALLEDERLGSVAKGALAEINGIVRELPVLEGLEELAKKIRSGEVGLDVPIFTALLDSGDADEWLQLAVTGDSLPLQREAWRRIRKGAGTDKWVGQVLSTLSDLPAPARDGLIRALAARVDQASALRAAVLPLMLESDAAMLAFAHVGMRDDVPALLAQASKGNGVAQETLATMEAEGTNAELAKLAGSSDEAGARAALDALEARGAADATQALWLMLAKKPVFAEEVLPTIGKITPPEELPNLLTFYRAQAGKRLEDIANKAVWDTARRMADKEDARAKIEAARDGAPESVAAALDQMLTRLQSEKPARKKSAVSPLQLPDPKDRVALAPNGYRLLANLDCGTAAEARGGEVLIRRTKGEAWEFAGPAHPLLTVDFGAAVEYSVSGLQPGGDYVIGLAMADGDLGRRRQSIALDGSVVIPNLIPLGYHQNKPTGVRLFLPVPTKALADGKVTVSATNESGPNAVVSGLWVMQREKAAVTEKRILILTGDDFPGHHWRVTGPRMAEMLRADPRLEVTVSESPYLLGSTALAHYDAVMVHFKNYSKRLPTTEALWENFGKYVRDGGGLVVAHFGCGALQEWDGFVDIAGRVWDPKLRGHDPYGPFEVRITDAEHPVTRKLSDFKTEDELYTCLAGGIAVKTLAEATSIKDKKDYPMALAGWVGSGRVFHCPLGHDVNALKGEDVANLYRRGAAWAAGLDPDPKP